MAVLTTLTCSTSALSVVTLGFDLVFMVQHYVLYRGNDTNEDSEAEEEGDADARESLSDENRRFL